MQIRPATPDDAEPIERIRIRGWQTAYRNVFPPAELDRLPIDPSRWRVLLAGGPPHLDCFVCENELSVIGWATTGASSEPGLGELHGLYVDPDSWSTGAGRLIFLVSVPFGLFGMRLLIEHAERELAGEYASAVLWTLEANARARRFYEHAGWELDGLRGTFERLGITARTVRYGKALSSSTSRA